jgi:hypothetical protein
MFGLGRQTKRVIVAVVYDQERRGFLLVYNPRWKGYTFPTRPWPAGNVADALQERKVCERQALAAFREDLGPRLGEATEPHWMERIEAHGVSGRTGRPTHYLFDVVTLRPVEPLPAGGFAGRFGWLTAEEILADAEPDGLPVRLVTWTTRRILAGLLEDQQVAVAIVSRLQAGQREYLMLLNRYAKWFFPAKRMDDEVSADRTIRYEFLRDAHYYGSGIDVAPAEVVSLEQHTGHLGTRQYTFHLQRTTFPGVDLAKSGNRLEASLDQAGKPSKWIPAQDLHEPLSDNISPTVRGLRETVLRLGE